MRKKFTNKKATGFLALVLAGIMALGGSLAYYTDREQIQAAGDAGSLDISIDGKGIDLKNSDGQDIIDPGDQRQFSYTVIENGNLSSDIRERIVINVTQVNSDTEKRPLNIQDNKNMPIVGLWDGTTKNENNNNVPGIDGATTNIDSTNNEITYTFPYYTLSGNPKSENCQNDAASNTKTHTYWFCLSKQADNAWQEAGITMNIIVEGKQHRNTGGVSNKWKELSKSTYYTMSSGEQHSTKIQTVTPQNKEAYFTAYGNFQLKRIAGDGNKIKHIVWTDQEPAANLQNKEHNIATASYNQLGASSNVPIYATYDNITETILLYSEAEKVHFNDSYDTTFQALADLEDIDVSRIDVSDATYLDMVFSGCPSLKTIKGLDTWDTTKVTSMYYMFGGDKSLTTLDLSSFDFSNKEVGDMFSDCTALREIKVKPSSGVPKATISQNQNVFSGCTSLPNFDSSKTGVDMFKTTDQGGYLTLAA